jgi:acyl-CoA thioester hydrolase
MNRDKYEVAVRFSDVDALGHVNYAVYLSYLEDALNQLWLNVLSTVGKDFNTGNPGIVSARTEIDYRAPALYNQNLEVEIWVSGIGNTSFNTMYRIVEKNSGKLLTEARTVQVVTFAGEQTGKMPEKIRAALEPYCCE